jgi:hypothetical protein
VFNMATSSFVYPDSNSTSHNSSPLCHKRGFRIRSNAPLSLFKNTNLNERVVVNLLLKIKLVSN